MTDLLPVLRYPGSKARIARWIASHFPPHRTYLEPFCGSLSVLFAKPPSPIELLSGWRRVSTRSNTLTGESAQELLWINPTAAGRFQPELPWSEPNG